MRPRGLSAAEETSDNRPETVSYIGSKPDDQLTSFTNKIEEMAQRRTRPSLAACVRKNMQCMKSVRVLAKTVRGPRFRVVFLRASCDLMLVKTPLISAMPGTRTSDLKPFSEKRLL